MFPGLEELLQPRIEQGPDSLHLQAKAGRGQLQRIPDRQHILALQLPLGVLRKTALVRDSPLACPPARFPDLPRSQESSPD